ncbi:MAG: type II toxin-antitoxin system mRNA interferase toxin, RelE/StbE family [Nitrospirae bacterium CG_4_10_14_0_8_um_filter_41_23]|nr:MAG: type II toxin-antitoxin system mRNA interferase toxin, RelE/StbE family [Nitrospirae bacterium CG11_big_fil_rev_8_21_14_0_20_41_14]PIV42364.1 MAG: type II toxin-antitoxin system mRNA interferase toxin, RelE/StbE family [Nitrospirae bacterium CG02_land_8_20_14_3_00_41_53]PIW88245.1 MAG: type II toxin-antitoxin system mRNA interferase toxin, RelE/StbE family [Nitrospirae bacterium CG_4_8_14_3_um_filter_41_47]PIY87347.1 MAG: type II toxin-antitoxin system mRNA interferase toxin, RelE/StbE f
MIKITWDHGFKRIYKKKIKNNEELKKRFWDAIELFSKEPFNFRLRTHKLTGKLEGLWAFSVSYDCRIIFKFLDKNEFLLIDIGGHDEVY